MNGVTLRDRDRRAMELIFDYWRDRPHEQGITPTKLKHEHPGVSDSKQVQRVRDRLDDAGLIKTREQPRDDDTPLQAPLVYAPTHEATDLEDMLRLDREEQTQEECIEALEQEVEELRALVNRW